MGATRDDFVKYPRTPHLFGSTGTDDDKHLGERLSREMLADPSLIVEEKLDGTNTGIHFTSTGRLVLQCRGHEITTGNHPQYDLFKQWVFGRRHVFESMLADRYILFGEWLYAKHSVFYARLPHYFFEFDVYDKLSGEFLDLESRLILLEGTGVHTVPVVHHGSLSVAELEGLIGVSAYGATFDNPLTGRPDDRMEGVYLRTEAGGVVTARAKFVRPEFTERVKLSEHWMHSRMVPNELAPGAEIWS